MTRRGTGGRPAGVDATLVPADALAWLPARPQAAEGYVQGPPYHCDINAMRALFPQPGWAWPKPPYVRTTPPKGLAELAVVLERR